MKRLFNLKTLSAAAGLLAIIIVWFLFAPIQIGGQAFYIIINGNSMEPLFHKGDLVLLRESPEYRIGDIVAYRFPDLGTVFHRIVAEDAVSFIMQGDNNSWTDGFYPEYKDIIGKYWFKLGGAGKVLEFLKSPWKIALITGVFCLIMGLSMIKQIGNKNKNSDGTVLYEKAGFQLASWRNSYWWIMYALGLIAIVLGIISFIKPLSKTITNKIPFQQSGQFAYSGSTDQNVYDTYNFGTGEPVFMNITCFAKYTFDYAFTPADSFSGGGSYQLMAEIQGNNGWTRYFTLTPITNFTGTQFHSESDLNLCSLRDVILKTESITDVQHNQYSLILTPNIKINGQFMGQGLSTDFNPSLTLTMDQQQVYLPVGGGTDENPFKPTTTGFIEQTEIVKNTIKILSWDLPVTAGRTIAIILFWVALLGILLPVLIFKKSEKENDLLKAKLLLGQSLLETKSSPIGENEKIIDLTSLEDLAQLAERTGAPVFFNQKALFVDYLVRQNNLAFRFRQVSQTATSGEEDGLRAEILEAIKKNELLLYYQPVKSLQTGQISQISALVRWNHPTRGFLTAREFLPQTEISSVVGLIDNWVLETACAQMNKWQESGLRMPITSITIFAQQLKDPSLAKTIEDALLNNHVKPNQLCIEISMDQLVFDAAVLNNLKNIKQMGVLITVKSTDQKSMDKLYKLENVDQIKLGQSLVEKAATNDKIGKATQKIIDLAHKNKMEVIAAGVETDEQMGFFRLNACDDVQGYLISHPLSIDEVEAEIKKHN
jgi:signal peptidase I